MLQVTRSVQAIVHSGSAVYFNTFHCLANVKASNSGKLLLTC